MKLTLLFRLNPDPKLKPEHELVRNVVHRQLLPVEYRNLTFARQVRRVFNGVRKVTAIWGRDHDDLVLVKQCRWIFLCRPYGGMSLLVSKGQPAIPLGWSCKSRLCPYCYARDRLLPAYRHAVTTFHGQQIGFAGVSLTLPGGLDQVRSGLLVARREAVRLLKMQLDEDDLSAILTWQLQLPTQDKQHATLELRALWPSGPGTGPDPRQVRLSDQRNAVPLPAWKLNASPKGFIEALTLTAGYQPLLAGQPDHAVAYLKITRGIPDFELISSTQTL